MMTTEEIACPNCKAQVLFPPANRIVTIRCAPGEEPEVLADAFAPYELVAVLERALDGARDDMDNPGDE